MQRPTLMWPQSIGGASHLQCVVWVEMRPGSHVSVAQLDSCQAIVHQLFSGKVALCKAICSGSRVEFVEFGHILFKGRVVEFAQPATSGMRRRCFYTIYAIAAKDCARPSVHSASFGQALASLPVQYIHVQGANPCVLPSCPSNWEHGTAWRALRARRYCSRVSTR